MASKILPPFTDLTGGACRSLALCSGGNPPDVAVEEEARSAARARVCFPESSYLFLNSRFGSGSVNLA